jgi:hypothetical protein
MYSFDAFAVVFADAFAVICVVIFAVAFTVTSVAAFAATKAWIAIKAIFVTLDTPVIPVTPVTPDAPDTPPDAPDTPEPQLVSVLRTVPDDDWNKSWSVDKILMLKMTSKSLNEVINKMQLPKPEVTVTLRFDNNKESELKMKSLSMFVKKNKIAKLELKCSNVRFSTYDLCKVVSEDDAHGEWFETVLQHHARLAMLNDQSNYFEPPVYDTWYAYSTPGGPHIMWTFEP